jgi:hypothetical protein
VRFREQIGAPPAQRIGSDSIRDIFTIYVLDNIFSSAYPLGMRNWLITFTAAAIASASPLCAEEFSETPQGELIMRYESAGGRNIPNFRFDPIHTAGGRFQITDTNWLHYAKQLSIDTDRYPNAMSAPEQLQGQVAGKMWAEQGFMPWDCCNAQFREHLKQRPELLKVRRRTGDKPHGPVSEAPVQAKAESPEPHNWNVFAAGTREGGQSFLITGEGR